MLKLPPPLNLQVKWKWIIFSLVLSFFLVNNIETVYGATSYPTISQRLENLPTYCIISPSGVTATDRADLMQLATSGVSKWNEKLQNYEKTNPEFWAINSRVMSSGGNTAGCDVKINFKETVEQISDREGFTVLGIFRGASDTIDIAFKDLSLELIFNVMIHEIGHSMGLGHYVSDNNELNEKWYSGKVFSPSIMIPTMNYDPNKMDVMETDILKVRSIYGNNGFYAFSPISPPSIPTPTPSPIPIPRPEPIIPIKPIESIQITEDNILVSKYDSKIVKIKGKIKDDIVLLGKPVYITIKSQDGFVAHKLQPTKKGFFELPMVFDGNSEKGWFEVEASYLEHTDTSMNFYFYVGKPIINYTETIIPEIEEKTPTNAISGKYLENISVESKNNNYTVTSYFTKNIDALSSIRITVDNECPKKKEIFKKDFRFAPGQKNTFSFYQLPDGKPSECALHFTLSDFEGKILEQIMTNYTVEQDIKNNDQTILNDPISPEILTPSIPIWVKNVAGFWCENKIQDASFIEGIQYLIKTNRISISVTVSETNNIQDIPDWIKNNACWWSQGLIESDDFLKGIQHLIQRGVIQIN